MSDDKPVIPRRNTYSPKRDLTTLAGRLGAAWDLLAGRPFSPGLPVEPDPVTNGQTPRQFQFTVGQNTSRFPRGESIKGVSLTPFDQLRQLAGAYDVASLCIATRVEQMQGLQWSIVPKDKRRIGDTQVMKRLEALTHWWMYPDRINDFPTWVGMLVYEILSIDAMTVYRRHTRSGHLYSLEIVDGSTIKPIIDERGRTVGYQQVMWGETISNYTRAYADAPDEQIFLTPQDLIYRPRYGRSFTPYGFPPTEWIILRVNTALRKQTQDLAHFTDGNIPAMLASPPDGLMDPQQLREFEELFNADLAGVDRARAKIKFMPFNPNLTPLSPFNYSTEVDEWMMKVTCAAFGVTPSELGFTADINRATALAQESITYRRGIEGMAQWLKTMFDRIIHDDFASPDLEWQWNFGKTDDRMLLAQLDQLYTGMGVLTPDEVRSMRFGSLLGQSPHGEAQNEESNRGRLGTIASRAGMWNTLSKSDVPLLAAPIPEPTIEDVVGDQFPNDPVRSALASAVQTRIQEALMYQQQKVANAVAASMNPDSPVSLDVAMHSSLANEPERIANDIHKTVHDAIRMGAMNALQQETTHPSYAEMMAAVKMLADQEALRIGTYITETTRSHLERILSSIQKADFNKTMIGNAFAPQRSGIAASTANRAYHLGVMYVAKHLGRGTIWSTADCPTCTDAPVGVDLIPSLNASCRCTLVVAKE